ncbi:MAG: SH3 domain-containing protein [Candidatus Roseilinea sp.]|uniref:SH3 domain-containing protein n=1 Tax=Candidatus Roseilinea sp. TaxID=2838777 RepID=UPI004049E67B
MALGCVGILVLLSLVAMPAQYLFSGPGMPASTPARAIAQARAQRPTRTPRQMVELSPIPAQPISQDDGGNALVERPSATPSPTDTPESMPTATASPTPTNTPAPTLTPSPAPTLAPTSTPEPTPTFTPTPSPTPPLAARVTPFTGTQAVNIRSGPGLGYAVIGVLKQGEFITVTGATQDRSWWRVELKGKPAWVSARVVRMDGDGQSVEIVPAAEIPRLPPRPPATTQPTAAPGN